MLLRLSGETLIPGRLQEMMGRLGPLDILANGRQDSLGINLSQV